MRVSELHLVSSGVLALALLGHVEAEVLQQDDGAGGGVGAGGLHLCAHAVLQEGHVPAQERERVGVIFVRRLTSDATFAFTEKMPSLTFPAGT